MKRGRIVWQGVVHEITQDNNGRIALLDGGGLLDESEVIWLPPVEPGVIFALGLNYADHAKELAFKAPEVPLVFLKGPNTIIGHRANTRRPAGTVYMHYECELVVVIGKSGYKVAKEDAYDMVAGYTVANDYAIRDYLENYYRPNLRVKNRDGCTPLGPWLIDRDDVPNPMQLKLTTRVNGKLTQTGTTSDMIFDIATLIEYLSSFMTLNPGDMILTGTPEGLADTKVGDVIETEIEGICCLVNTIVDDEKYFTNAVLNM
jgi:5-oxopent-3-ene-1,2,5-tricarboxylate decarboxylase/2-hydroxyhepta-2,4-diene-1,7-dioate isomerase